jgi:hypothetical protein
MARTVRVVDVLEQVERAGDVDRGVGDRLELRDVSLHEPDVLEPAARALGLGEGDGARGGVDADGLAHAGREQEADVPARRAEVQEDRVGRRGPPGEREPEDVAVALAPLALGRREARDPVEPVVVLVRVELGLERHF